MFASARPARARNRAAGLFVGLLSAIATTGGWATPAAHAQINFDRLRGWGFNTALEIEEHLRIPGTRLYAESASLNGTRSGGFNGKAFVWPISTQFRVLNTLTDLQPTTYTPILRQFSDQVRANYWDVSGYRAGALPGTVERFYDDNAHMVVALAEAYQITGDQAYLNRAIETQAFVMSGEDSRGGGGIYFKQSPSDNSKNTISVLQGARGAALLYQITGNTQYRTDANRLLLWARSRVQQNDALFYQGYDLGTNAPVGVNIVNSAGTGIAAYVAMYNATGGGAYLSEAQRIANAAVGRYFNATTGALNDEGYWAFELSDALVDLYKADKNPAWLLRVDRALQYLHENKEDPNGHYGLFWGREGTFNGTLSTWHLNEQASVARAYLYASAVPEPTTIAALAGAAMLVTRRRRS